jgi:hypothetical protein
MTNDGEEIGLATCFYTQNGKSIIFVMKRYALDDAGKNFRRRRVACFHQPSVALHAHANGQI